MIPSDYYFILKEVTPQLFARLSSHPEQVIRKQLEGLIVMLAKISPWSVVYPTLVDVNAYEEGHSEELQHVLACLVMKLPLSRATPVMYLLCELTYDGLSFCIKA